MTPELLQQWGGAIMFMMALAALVRVGQTMQPDDLDDERVAVGAMAIMHCLLLSMMLLAQPAGGIA